MGAMTDRGGADRADAGPEVPEHAAELRAVLDRLHDLIGSAKAMPMSASCVVNRSEALALIDRAVAAIPEPAAAAPATGEADRIIDDARARASELIAEQTVVIEAKREAEEIVARATEEAEGLRTETDGFVDSRMASFESVLHKTMSQVQLARARLSQRSRLDGDSEDDAEA